MFIKFRVFLLIFVVQKGGAIEIAVRCTAPSVSTLHFPQIGREKSIEKYNIEYNFT